MSIYVCPHTSAQIPCKGFLGTRRRLCVYFRHFFIKSKMSETNKIDPNSTDTDTKTGNPADKSALDDLMDDLEKDEGKDPKTAKEQSTAPEQYEGTDEEWNKLTPEKQTNWKFENQSSNFTKKLQETHDENYKLIKEACDVNPAFLKRLADGNDKDIKMAKRIAKEVYQKPLADTLKEIDEAIAEVGEDGKKIIKSNDNTKKQGKREALLEISTNNFVKENSVLDINSSDYDRKSKEIFDRKVEILSTDEYMTVSELEEIHEIALELATKHLTADQKKKAIKQAKVKISSAGNGNSKSPSNVKNDPWAGAEVLI